MKSDMSIGAAASGDQGGGPPPSILVLFAGSVLMGDDGVALAALERLRSGWETGPGVELVDGGTWGMNLLPAIESSDRVLIVDAVRAGREPGAVVRLDGERIPRFFATKLSPHQIDLKEVLALAELRGTLPTTVAVGVEPGRVELSTALSTEVEAAVPELVQRIVEILAEWGAPVRRAEARRESRPGSPARWPPRHASPGRPCAVERAARKDGR